MRIEEIYLTVQREDPSYICGLYQNGFEDSPVSASFKGLDLRNADHGDRLLLGMFDEQTLVAVLVVLRLEQEHQIGRIATLPNYSRQGWMRCLITYFVNNIGDLYSDDTQSSDAQAMWTSLIVAPGDPRYGSMSIFLVRHGEQPIKLQSSGPNHEIVPNPWDDTDCRILARKRVFTTEQIERYRNSSARKIRPIEWYGPATISDTFYNP